MPHRLDGIRMEKHILFTADFADFLHRLNGADFVIGRHHRYKASVLLNRCRYLLRADNSVFVYIHEGYRKALFF